LMKTLDDAWNPRDWETFMKRHAENVALYWPGQPEPTRARGPFGVGWVLPCCREPY